MHSQFQMTPAQGMAGPYSQDGGSLHLFPLEIIFDVVLNTNYCVIQHDRNKQYHYFALQEKE